MEYCSECIIDNAARSVLIRYLGEQSQVLHMRCRIVRFSISRTQSTTMLYRLKSAHGPALQGSHKCLRAYAVPADQNLGSLRYHFRPPSHQDMLRLPKFAEIPVFLDPNSDLPIQSKTCLSHTRHQTGLSEFILPTTVPP